MHTPSIPLFSNLPLHAAAKEPILRILAELLCVLTIALTATSTHAAETPFLPFKDGDASAQSWQGRARTLRVSSDVTAWIAFSLEGASADSLRQARINLYIDKVTSPGRLKLSTLPDNRIQENDASLTDLRLTEADSLISDSISTSDVGQLINIVLPLTSLTKILDGSFQGLILQARDGLTAEIGAVESGRPAILYLDYATPPGLALDTGKIDSASLARGFATKTELAEVQKLLLEGNTNPKFIGSLQVERGRFQDSVSVGGPLNVGGMVRVSSNGAQAIFNSHSPAIRDINFMTGDVGRWTMRVDGSAETGDNSGSDFYIIARTDSGAGRFTPIAMRRKTGNVIINGSPTSDDGIHKLQVNGGLSATSGFFSELLSAKGGFVVDGGSSGPGRLWKSAPNGLAIRGMAGSSYDWAIESPGGNALVANPTGTQQVLFPNAGGIQVVHNPANRTGESHSNGPPSTHEAAGPNGFPLGVTLT